MTTTNNFTDKISNEEAAALPAIEFRGEIRIVDNERDIVPACKFLMKQRVIGFDTETRPSFRPGVTFRVSLLQLSTPQLCFLFRLNKIPFAKPILQVLESKEILKIGADVAGDLRSLRQIRHFRDAGFVDLQTIAPQWGIGEKSLRKLSAIVLGQRVSKAQRLSNWEAATFTDKQKLYAATDAWVCTAIYGRLTNATQGVLEARIAALEGGTAALAVASGAAAIAYTIQALAQAGEHIVAQRTLYGGTYNLLAVTMKRMGLECTFVSPDCTDEELEAAFRPNTKAVFGETIANPALAVLDIERFAAAAHAHGVPLIVDNTFPTPVNCRPIEWGADIVTHSTTKYMDGHGASVGGAIVDSGKFDWTAHADKFPGLCEPDESYHGVTYTERFGLGGAFITKATAQLMRDFGAIQSPQNAYLVNLGLESLHLRMAQHSKNGLALAQHLAAHPKIAWVRYPGLPGDDQYELAQKYLSNGASGVVSFGVAGGRAAAETFMANLKLAQIATHVADARTCVLHPANATHRQMNDAELAAAGITPDLIRLSCGIEATEDLVADIDQALAAV